MQEVIQNSLSGKRWIEESTTKGLVSADICSAYIRSEAFRYFFKDIFNSGATIRVLARWALSDLLAQASDLITYELCKANNIEFYIKQDFHGKVYGLNPHGVLLGSFNLTNRGFSISDKGNDEAGVLIQNSKDSDEYFDDLFKNARKVDDNLYEKISTFINENINKNDPVIFWPDEIINLISLAPVIFRGQILVDECFASTFNEFMNAQSDAKLHDLSLLSLNQEQGTDLGMIRVRFKSTKIFRWFVTILREDKEGLYFGKATALLHDQLFDDPKPYRQEVKNLLANLLSWIEGLKLDEISIDRPNHSQRIILKT